MSTNVGTRELRAITARERIVRDIASLTHGTATIERLSRAPAIDIDPTRTRVTVLTQVERMLRRGHLDRDRDKARRLAEAAAIYRRLWDIGESAALAAQSWDAAPQGSAGPAIPPIVAQERIANASQRLARARDAIYPPHLRTLDLIALHDETAERVANILYQDIRSGKPIVMHDFRHALDDLAGHFRL